MVIWFMLAALYLVLQWTLGLMTFRKGHHVLFLGRHRFPHPLDHRRRHRAHPSRRGSRSSRHRAVAELARDADRALAPRMWIVGE
jgi:hypothetical protein